MAVGVAESLVRMGVGLEEAEDLIADLEQAFESTSPHTPHLPARATIN